LTSSLVAAVGVNHGRGTGAGRLGPRADRNDDDRAADPVELAAAVALVVVVFLESSEPGAKR
jgi:hypothetical protein